MTKIQATVFSLVLAAGVGSSVFFFKHLKKESETLPVVDPDKAPPAELSNPTPEDSAAAAAAAAAATAAAAANATPTPTAKPETQPSQDELFREPEKLMTALADLVKSRDAKAFIAMAGENAISEEVRPALIELLENPAYAPAAEDPVLPLARLSDATRWAIQLEPSDKSQASPEATDSVGLPDRHIYVDLSPVEGGKLWEITEVLVPGTVASSADAVTVALQFSRAVMSSDFNTARALTDPDKITDEKIAALMIAIEEGGYGLHHDRPLTQTLDRDTVSWIIARIQSADLVSEFGLEMSRLDAENSWVIDNISFDKVIQMTAASAGGGDVAYAPIVTNAEGGDSLVVFFEFDSSALNARGLKQVEAIAHILKNNPARQININGHADALGLDDYNASLSSRRAQAVKDELISQGVSIDQIVTKGFGESAPLSPNFKPDGSDNPSGRSHNRRTEVYLNF